MSRRVDVLNRLIFGLLGLILAAAGTLGLLARDGAMALRTPAAVYTDVAEWTLQNRRTVGVAASAAILLGVVLTLMGLRWAAAQLRRRGGHLQAIALQRLPEGRTSVAAAAAASAVARDLERLPGVTAAAARVVEGGRQPRLLTRADVLADADLAAVRAGAEDVYARLAHCLGVHDVRADLRLRPTEQEPARVH